MLFVFVYLVSWYLVKKLMSEWFCFDNMKDEEWGCVKMILFYDNLWLEMVVI